MSIYEERGRLAGLGYFISYSCYGVTVKYQGHKIFDAPKTFSPGPRIEQHEAMARQSRRYLELGIEKAQAHEERLA